jgi:hypothetical protein
MTRTGNWVQGQWEPVLTKEEYEAVTEKWMPYRPVPSRLGAIGKGHGTVYLLSPFLRCGKCSARMHGGRRNRHGELVEGGFTGARQRDKGDAAVWDGMPPRSRSTSRHW